LEKVVLKYLVLFSLIVFCFSIHLGCCSWWKRCYTMVEGWATFNGCFKFASSSLCFWKGKVTFKC